jgi:hypothetical protein
MPQPLVLQHVQAVLGAVRSELFRLEVVLHRSELRPAKEERSLRSGIRGNTSGEASPFAWRRACTGITSRAPVHTSSDMNLAYSKSISMVRFVFN